MQTRSIIPGLILVIGVALTSLPAMGADTGSTALHPRTPISCGTSWQLRTLSGHENDRVRYRCERRTLRQAIEAMDNSDIYLTDAEQNGFYVRFPGEILFGNADATLPEGSRSLLEELADILKEYPDSAVVVRGHASGPRIATEEFPSNQALSEARARSVARYLIQRQGVSRECISEQGFGTRSPHVEEIDADSERLNRRVDFFIHNGV